MTALRLVVPSADYLPGYVAALREGWSPNNLRDVSGEHLAAIAADADAFLRTMQPYATGTVRLGDGREVARIPGAVLWMWDDAFCGAINYRHLPGTEDLPPHVSGHVGYAVVPPQRGRGVATAALRLLLPVLHAAGLPRVLITCDETNAGSRKVIEANGGVFDGTAVDLDEPGVTKLRFWVATGAGPAGDDSLPDVSFPQP